MTKSELVFPPRLIEDQTDLAVLLRQAEAEPTRFPSEVRAWHGLVAKQERGRRAWRYGAVVFAGACLVLGFGFLSRDNGLAQVGARAEALLPEGVGPTNVSEVAAVALPRVEVAKVQPTRKPQVNADVKDVSVLPKAAVDEANPPPREDGADDSSQSNDTHRCTGLARQGKLDEAVVCYGELAEGSGMASELALYEKARLEARALGRAEQALATLDAHIRRFPRGVLSTEVELTRIELLTRQGRTDEALTAITAALAGPIGAERGPDLQVLRGDLLSNRGDCAGAIPAYAAARQAGIHPSRLKMGEQRCAQELKQ